MAKKEPIRRARHKTRPPRRPLRILHVAAEASPFVKTGGLADAVSGLAAGLAELDHDVRILLPAYGSIRDAGWRLEPEARFRAPRGLEGVELLAAELPRARAGVWLLDHPAFAERGGNPYLDDSGLEYLDNAERFDRLCRLACALAADAAGLKWRPDVVHIHDWHAGLVPIHLQLRRLPIPVVFTIHNLAYQGLFGFGEFTRLHLPAWLWHPEAVEFFGRLSFMKAALNFADLLATVSPTFAREILTSAYGEGLEGVLQRRARDLTGILNGLDRQVWNPEVDPHIPARFSATDLGGKSTSKAALRRRFCLAEEPSLPIAAFIGRLAPQKGIDLILNAIGELLELPLQLVILASGHGEYARDLTAAAKVYPDRLSLILGHDESLAHLVEAGADLLLMPSRYEPCGLTQMQALAYGTVPVVRACGGLADTVVDADEATLADGTATGFTFGEATAPALVGAVRRALGLWANAPRWQALMRSGMARDFSWRHSAQTYLEWYVEALALRRGLSY